ncbi:MAG: hypothetical protein IJE24_00665 [Oscillospiraceae bacterium]|nr:hypothetical protein [Oscillospiraceae bacterium]
MKKILLWVCLAVMIAALTIPVAAAPSAKLTASKTSVNAGDTVTVKASVSALDCKAGGVEVSFDSKVFELTSGKWLLDGAFITDFSAASKDGVFAYTGETGISGNILELTLKVKDSAASGKSTVKVSLTLDGETVQRSIGITVACKHKYDNSCDATCNICGEKRSVSHSWNSGTVNKNATCTTDGSKTVKCTVCGETKTETIKATGHNYANGCDTTCANCGQTRTTTHQYGEAWKTDKTSHWHECTECGDEKDVADHIPGPEATDYTPQVCTVCGYVIQKALVHTHVPSEEWVTDDTGHWHTCLECDEIPDYAEHTFDNECDKECNECCFTREVGEHNYLPQWAADNDGHWHECGYCGDRLEMEPHVPGPEATEFEAQICMICGFELTPMLHQHDYADKSDADKHWQECPCGHIAEEAPHTWDEGTVKTEPAVGAPGEKEYKCTVCGVVKTEEIPALEPAEPQQEGLLVTTDMLIIAGAGAVLLCTLCLVVGILIGKKTGRRRNEY